KAALRQKVAQWQRTLDAHGLTDLGVAQPGWDNGRVRAALALSWLPAKVGWLFHYLPFRLGKYVSDTQVVRPEFKLSVALGVALGATLVWYLIWIVAVGLLFGLTAILWLLVLGALTGLAAVWRADLASWYRQARAFRSLAQGQQEALLAQRKALLDYFFHRGADEVLPQN
ncbi:MAG: hypothetical protein D6818_06385, partial [Bacteroidetes bacterium]